MGFMIASTSLGAFSTTGAAGGRVGAAPAAAAPAPGRAPSPVRTAVAPAGGAGSDGHAAAAGPSPDRIARRGSRLDILA